MALPLARVPPVVLVDVARRPLDVPLPQVGKRLRNPEVEPDHLGVVDNEVVVGVGQRLVFHLPVEPLDFVEQTVQNNRLAGASSSLDDIHPGLVSGLIIGQCFFEKLDDLVFQIHLLIGQRDIGQFVNRVVARMVHILVSVVSGPVVVFSRLDRFNTNCSFVSGSGGHWTSEKLYKF